MLRDRLYVQVFTRLFVYNILFEDSEVDETILDVKEDSSILSITGAGCGVAGMVHRNPRRIDAVDINRHHLALTALKIRGAQMLSSYAEFYDLFGRGYAVQPSRLVRRVTDGLPSWIQRYWKSHHKRFHEPYHRQGMTAQIMSVMRRMLGVDAEWFRGMIRMSVEDRHRLIDDWITPVFNRPYVKAFLESPIQYIGFGINYEQRDRMLGTAGQEITDFYISHMKRVAATDLERNWFGWYTIAGQHNHDNPEAIPPYLRRDRHEHSLESSVSVGYHHGNILDVLRSAGPNTWSHYTLCDAPDWMPLRVQKTMLNEIARTARPGALVLRRTVEDDCIIERHNLGDRFMHREDLSSFATENDRTRQYRRVDVYQVAA